MYIYLQHEVQISDHRANGIQVCSGLCSDWLGADVWYRCLCIDGSDHFVDANALVWPALMCVRFDHLNMDLLFQVGRIAPRLCRLQFTVLHKIPGSSVSFHLSLSLLGWWIMLSVVWKFL